MNINDPKLPPKKKYPRLPPIVSQTSQKKVSPKTHKIRTESLAGKMRKIDSVTEINVSRMNLQNKASFVRGRLTGPSRSIESIISIRGKKKRIRSAIKMSAQTLYKKKAIEGYKSNIEKEAPTMGPHQYSVGIHQQNLREVQTHWKSRIQKVTKLWDDTDSQDERMFIGSSLGHPRVLAKKGKGKRRTTMKKPGLSYESDRTRSFASAQTQTPLLRHSIVEAKGSICNLSSLKRSLAASESFTNRRKMLRQHRYDQYHTYNKSLQQFQRFQVSGVRAITLNTNTQNTLHLTQLMNLESPWFSVNVDELLDNIRMVTTYSDALKMLEIVVPYMGNDLLMGYFPYQCMFLVCTTPEAKSRVITMLEEDLRKSRSSFESRLRRTPFRWMSLGSELEIPEEIEEDWSPLVVLISVVHPLLFQEEIKFKMRTVQQARDGYVEILCQRRTYSNIYRRKQDAITQTTQSNVTTGTDTGIKVMNDNSTQYKYQYVMARLSNQQNLNLGLFLNQEYENIALTLQQNTHMRLFVDDYTRLRHQSFRRPDTPKEILQFWEPKYCKGKSVALVVWNPWVSGNIAVVYSDTPNIVSAETFTKANQEEENNILIWNYGDGYIPEILLNSEKVITTVSFCPHNRRIIVGGSATGDILMWLLPEGIGRGTKPQQEFLSEGMSYNRHLMRTMSSWMKNLYESTKIQVRASSNSSHLGRVNCIKWLLPGYKFSLNGELTFQDNTLQFISCGMDGHMIIWDVPERLTTSSVLQSGGKKRRLSKSTRSASIRKEKTLLPSFRIEVSLTGSPNCLTSIQIPDQNVKFEVVERTTKKRMYTSIEDPHNEHYSSIYLATNLGTVMKATWDRYDRILKVTNGNLVVSEMVHDGPITAFVMHPILPNLLLSVGGQVCAVWYVPKMRTPFFWRRRPVPLVSGFWSTTNAEEFTIATFDAHLETWNFLKTDKCPLRTKVVTKFQIASLFNDVETQHAHRNTLIVADYFGNVKVYTNPKEGPAKGKITRQEFEDKVQKVFQYKEMIRDLLLTKFRLKASLEPEPKPPQPEEIVVPPVIRSSKKSVQFSRRLKTKVLNANAQIKQWKVQRQEKIDKRNEVIIQKSIEKLKENILQPRILQTLQTYMSGDEESIKENLPCLLVESRRKMLLDKIQNRNSSINRNVDNILSQESLNVPKKIPAETNYQYMNRVQMKRQYVNEYKDMEGSILSYIKHNHYNYDVNWSEILDQSKHEFIIDYNL